MQVVSRYVNGVLQYCLSETVDTFDELLEFISIDRKLYGVDSLRIKAPYEDYIITNYLLSHGYKAVYHAYELNAPFSVNTSKHVVETVKWDAELLTGIRALIKECADRDGTEFSNQLDDPSWYTLGNCALGVKIGGRLVGFRIYEIIGDTMKLWMAYVYPECRGMGIYSSLLNTSLHLAQEGGVSKITVSTDCTDQPMHSILNKYGFAGKTTTWVEV